MISKFYNVKKDNIYYEDDMYIRVYRWYDRQNISRTLFWAFFRTTHCLRSSQYHFNLNEKSQVNIQYSITNIWAVTGTCTVL